MYIPAYFVRPMSLDNTFLDRIPRLKPKGIVASSFERAWLDGLTGRGITIAVADTGIYSCHPDLQGKVKKAYNFTEDDQYGIHGTHIAGTIAAEGNILGGAYGASLIDMKVVSEAIGSGVPEAIAAAILQATEEGCSVINLSLAATDLSYQAKTKISSAVLYAWNRGCICISASGNYGYEQPNLDNLTFPASVDLVQAVTSCSVSTDCVPILDDYSSENSRVCVSCVGTDVLSTVPGGYALFTGTSMASAHASAMACLLAEKLVRLGVSRFTPTFSKCLVNELRTHTVPFIRDRATHGYGFLRYDPRSPVIQRTHYFLDDVYVGDFL
jgi:subtilisin family serine protease